MCKKVSHHYRHGGRRKIEELDTEVTRLTGVLERIEQDKVVDAKSRKLRNEGWRRTIFIIGAAFVLMIGVTILALIFGDQQLNSVARVLAWWYVDAGIGTLAMVAMHFIVRKDRFRAMGIISSGQD